MKTTNFSTSQSATTDNPKWYWISSISLKYGRSLWMSCGTSSPIGHNCSFLSLFVLPCAWLLFYPLIAARHFGFDVITFNTKAMSRVVNSERTMVNKDHYCVPLSKNNRSKSIAGISYHQFPRNEELRRRWIYMIRRDIGKYRNPFDLALFPYNLHLRNQCLFILISFCFLFAR